MLGFLVKVVKVTSQNPAWSVLRVVMRGELIERDQTPIGVVNK